MSYVSKERRKEVDEQVTTTFKRDTVDGVNLARFHLGKMGDELEQYYRGSKTLGEMLYHENDSKSHLLAVVEAFCNKAREGTITPEDIHTVENMIDRLRNPNYERVSED